MTKIQFPKINLIILKQHLLTKSQTNLNNLNFILLLLFTSKIVVNNSSDIFDVIFNLQYGVFLL